MQTSFFYKVFGCCLGRSSSPDPEIDPLLPHPLHPEDYHSRELAVPRVIPSEEETLADIIRETESKMVNVQHPHPFLLRPPAARSSLTPSHSQSRTSSPSGSHSLTPDADNSERSTSMNPGFPPRAPILDVKLIKMQRGKARKLSGKGRGRDRTRARDGSPLVGNGSHVETEDPPKAFPLGRTDDDLLFNLSQDVRKSLFDGFQLRDSGKVIQSWDDT